MVWGLGIDLVHIPTLARIMQRNAQFKTAIFTAAEIAYCESRGERASQHFAARFAAKEAYWKATQVPCTWTDIEVVATPGAPPSLRSTGLTPHSALLSLSHHGEYATAAVLVLPAHIAPVAQDHA